MRPEHDELWKLQGFRLLRGQAQAELGRWEQAAADLTSAVEDDAGSPDSQIGLALAHLAGRDIDAYRKTCTHLLRDFGQTDDPRLANALAWTCVLEPWAVGDRDTVVRCARVAKAAATGDKHDFLNTLGAAIYRAGRFEEAIGHLNDALKALPEPGGPRTRIDSSVPGGHSVGPAPGGDGAGLALPGDGPPSPGPRRGGPQVAGQGRRLRSTEPPRTGRTGPPLSPVSTGRPVSLTGSCAARPRA